MRCVICKRRIFRKEDGKKIWPPFTHIRIINVNNTYRTNILLIFLYSFNLWSLLYSCASSYFLLIKHLHFPKRKSNYETVSNASTNSHKRAGQFSKFQIGLTINLAKKANTLIFHKSDQLSITIITFCLFSTVTQIIYYHPLDWPQTFVSICNDSFNFGNNIKSSS